MSERGSGRATRLLRGALLLVAVCVASACAPGVFGHANNNERTGLYTDQGSLTPALVSGGTFGQMFSASVTGQVYAQPVIAADTVLVATEANNIYGIDRSSGARKWSRNLGVAWNPNDVGCGDLTPSVGVTGTPVVDAASNTAYFFNKSYASGTSGAAVWYAHAIDIKTGNERAGWPTRIRGAASNVANKSFNPTTSLQRTGLLLLDGVIYAGFGGHCDHQPYSGWVVGVKTDGTISTLWAPSPGNQGAAGIWQSGGGLVSDGPGSIYLATGNGSTNVSPRPGNQPGDELGQAVVHLRVQPDQTLKAVDFYSPYDADTLDDADVDLASGGPVLLPPTPFSTPAHSRLIAIVGKQGYLYLLDAADLGGMKQGPSGGDRVVTRIGPLGGVWGQVATWPGDGGYLYVLPRPGGTGNGEIRVMKWGLGANGDPTLAEVARSAETAGFGSTAAVVSSDGTKSGSALLWVIARDGLGNGQLRAYDAVPVNGTLKLRWSGSLGQSTKFSIPAVFGSRVYVGTADGRLLSFGSPITQLLSQGPVSIPNTTVGQMSNATLKLKAASDLTISAISTTNSAFTTGTPTATNPSRSGLPMTLTTGDEVTVPIRFQPTQPGPANADVNVTTSVGNVGVSVSALGVNPVGVLQATPPVISFGGAPTGSTPVTVALSLTNVGSTGVTVNSVTTPAPPFSVTGLPAAGAVVAPLTSVVATASFAPGAVGNYASEVTLRTSAGDLHVPLTGASTPPPHMTLNPTTVAFGSTLVDAVAGNFFVISNTGGSPLTITKSKPPAAGRGFAAATPVPEGTRIAPGETIVVIVNFTPPATGATSDTWVLNGDDAGGERSITFTGTGANGTSVVGPTSGAWTTNGAAARQDPWLELTGLEQYARGSAFAPGPITATSVRAAFDAFIGDGSGADGLALAFGDTARGATRTSLGEAGGRLGFGGIPGAAVAIDTWLNADDPFGQFLGVTDGIAGAEAGTLHWLATAATVPSLRTAQHHVVIAAVNGYVSVRVDNVLRLSRAGVPVPPAFMLGFTGGSGGLTDSHRVRNVAISYR